MLKIVNAKIYREEGFFTPGEVEITGTKFGCVSYNEAVTEKPRAPFFIGGRGDRNAPAGGVCPDDKKPDENDKIFDAGGCYAIPGLIDIHLHGCAGFNFYDADPEGLFKMLQYQAANGVTAICPTTLTLPEDMLARACENIASIAERIVNYKDTGMRNLGAASPAREEISAEPLGVHLEGPFISPNKSGAQNPAFAIPPDVGIYKRLQAAANNLVKIVAVSPELDGVSEFIGAVAEEAVVSIAHTNADYDAVVAAFALGAKHVTHLYNAMSAFGHREPNAVGAALDTPGVTAELICDGSHLHPAAVRIAMRLLGAVRAVFISDSMMAAGLGDGIYDLGGLSVRVTGKVARLVEGGNIASSVSNLMDCMRVAVKDVGIPLADAVRCSSVNPARVLGAAGERGRISEGMIADLVLLDADLNIKEVFLRGRRL